MIMICLIEPCVTFGGPVNNQPCQFPFVWEGKVYDRCTIRGKDGKRDPKKAWCSTKKGFSDHTEESKTWGLCDKKCAHHEGFYTYQLFFRITCS